MSGKNQKSNRYDGLEWEQTYRHKRQVVPVLRELITKPRLLLAGCALCVLSVGLVLAFAVNWKAGLRQFVETETAK
jgi:hypothetical protein